MGAHASFTLGMFGANGGMGLEMGTPANQSVFVGYRTHSGRTALFPFFESLTNDAERFSQDDPASRSAPGAVVFDESHIDRSYAWASDVFSAPGVEMSIRTPFGAIPDPSTADRDALQRASCPATYLELTIANDSEELWDGFFAVGGGRPWTPLSHRSKSLRGMITCDQMGFATRDTSVAEFVDFDVNQALSKVHKTPNFLLGPIGGFSFVVEPGETKTVRFVVGYFMQGSVSYNRTAAYWYTQYFTSIESVFDYALDHYDDFVAIADQKDAELAAASLSEDQKFLIAHATRSYYGSTQWLVEDGKPLWVVNEGEYLMINTLDLTIDMAFFELRLNPWTVRNVLEHFASNYSYEDHIFAPEEPSQHFIGGVSFTHDMGVGNHFSPDQYSCYECAGIDRKCFSYMTYEELTNWILTAGLYVKHAQDHDFLEAHAALFERCLTSLLNRDHPDPALRNGLMGFDSSRTEGGGEITTYDSLDHSLGQARNNVYLAGKTWASYLALEALFKMLGNADLAQSAMDGALLTAAALEKAYDEDLGFIPAVLENDNRSAIIPAVEALIYPHQMGLQEHLACDGPFAGYLGVLKKHSTHILQSGMCLYADGAWKLSSSADNSWMSKICLNQFVIHEILEMSYRGEENADRAHVEWQINGSKAHACSDQFASGKPIGSLYYPRIVTNILWLEAARMQRVSLEKPESKLVHVC